MAAESSSSNIQKWSKITLFCFAIALPLAVIYNAAPPLSVLLKMNESSEKLVRETDTASVSVPSLEVNGQSKLKKVLKEAAMEDKTVILITLNEAWASPNSILDVFIKSFHNGEGTRNLLDHLVMIALDKKAYQRCKSIHPHCYALISEVDFSGEKDFMTDGYLKMMWRRLDFLRLVLELGYNFIFTDTDIVWFRNPIPHFHPDGDFQIACDQFNGNELDIKNRPNNGFNYVKSNNRTIEFYKFWYASREKYPRHHEQDVLNIIKFSPIVNKLGLKMRFLSTEYFGGICEKSRDFNKVCTMHANCCVGLDRKIHDLGVMLEDWRAFMSLPPAIKQSRQHKWSVPQICSLAPLHHH